MSGSQATKTKESDDLVELNPGPRQAVYLEQKRVQKGHERLERRCVAPYRGLPRKSGHGGKYTWEGPRGAEEDDDFPAAIDKKDPNYIDDAQGEMDRQVAHRVVEVPKAPAATAPSSSRS